MKIITMAPAEFKAHIKASKVFYTYQNTAGGTLQILATQQGIFQTQFVKKEIELKDYQRQATIKTENLILVGTPFQIRVWQAALTIKPGIAISYEQLASAIGKPTAFRAVANALGKNKIAYFVPCHRIVRKSGELGGYYWGLEVKRKLLGEEKS
jgi:O-6-methylguanine DNA methyltransferase